MLKRTILGIAILALIAPALWFGYAQTIRAVMTGWLEARAAEGWLVNYDDLSVTGFPSEFRTEFVELELADPETGWVWSLPGMVLEQRAFRPGEIRATWPSRQVLASPFERLTIRSDVMTSDLKLQPTADYALDLSDTRLADVRVESSVGWVMALPEGQLVMALREGAEAAYDVTFSAAGLVPPEPLRERLDPASILPDGVSVLNYDAVMEFDRPWDLRAIEERRPQIVRLDLREMEAAWGGLLLRAAGEIEVDASGTPGGSILVRAENWRDMVDMAVHAGLVPRRMQGTAEGILSVVAGLSGDPDVIDAELTFADGRTFLGPLPLGPAPNLSLR